MKVFAVIGSPIAQSKSPYMHNRNFERMNVPYSYVGFHVLPESLEDAIKGMRALQLSGLNVTIPHKGNVIPLLDEVDEEAKVVGAVNTIVNENGILKGYNTDVQGFFLGLQELMDNESVENKKALVIGAGGAARGICYALKQNGAIVTVANRTVSKAETLCSDLALFKGMSLKEAEETIGDYSIVVNTSSVGMFPKVNETPMNVDNICPGTFVVDIIYNPFETKFLQESKQRGAIIQNGLPMFVNQGALAALKWTGIFPDTKKMLQDMKECLGGTN